MLSLHKGSKRKRKEFETLDEFGKKNYINNYRPISIISAPTKVFEIALCKSIFSQVLSSISIHKHGFMHKRSTVSNSCNFTQSVVNVLVDGNQACVNYTYFGLRRPRSWDTSDEIEIVEVY